jgi:UrcA family protein
MSTSRHIQAVLRPRVSLIAAVAALTIAGAAQAADTLDEVTVTVPAQRTIGRSTNGAPIQEVSSSERIQYNATMLQTNSGMALLEDKVAQEAQRLCKEAETPGSVPMETEQACVKRAVAGAKEQIAAAAAAQKKTG